MTTAVPNSPLAAIRVDTAGVHKHQQFELWRDTLVGSHDVALPEGTRADSGFRAEAALWQCDGVLIAETRTDPQLLERNSRRIRGDHIDHYAVRLHRTDAWQGEVSDRHVETGAGEVMLLDLARPSRSRSSATDNVTVVLPRAAIDAAARGADLHGHIVRGGMGLILADWLNALSRALPTTEQQQVPGLIDITRNLVVAAVAPSTETIEHARPALDTGLLAQIDRVIACEIGSPSLSPQMICRSLGMSRSALYRACEPRGGVAAMIKEARLARIHALLSDPGETRRIFEIATLHGFVSETHFSREFRRAFGRSPREIRAMATADRPDQAIRAIWQRQLRG